VTRPAPAARGPGLTRGLLLVIFLALTVAVINLAQWFILERASRALEAETALRLTTVAAAAIGEATEELLLRADVGGDEFVRRTLEGVALRSDLEDVFLVDPEGELLLDVGSEALGEDNPYRRLHAGTFAAAAGGVPKASPTREVDGVVFKAAYAPVRDVDGTVGAVLGVAAGGGFLARVPALRRTLRLVSLGSAALVVLLGAAFFGMSRKLAATESALARSEALGAMGMMAAGVAHEVRNPLAIIAATAERLRKTYGGGAEDPLFGFIPEEVDRLNGILEGYLRFARDEPLRLADTDLARVVDRSTRLVAEEWAPRGVSFEPRGPGGPVAISGDPQRLTQVLLNVLINAAQAMPRGGVVRVELAREGASAAVRVSDSGPGFDERALRGAFEPFFTTKAQGSGLGLAMAKRIMEAHGGTIAIANRPEGGAVVTLRLPLRTG
jgi:signal transduction histidine kinase